MPKQSQGLNKIQAAVLRLLAESPIKNHFYWTGGTALVYFYLHSRRSFDIDLFSDTPVNYEAVNGFIGTLSQGLSLKRVEQKKVFDRWEFFLKNKEETRIEFVHYDHPRLGKLNKWNGIFADSKDDLVANKTMALIDRHQPKDAHDVYYIMHRLGYKPEKLLFLVQKKFKFKTSVSSFWSEALVAATRLSELKVLLDGSESDNKREIEEIQEFFKSESAKFLSREML